ncbi:hypothetical protein [Aliiroseovarius marinus]|uniref:hypothetical protein n=1 Tax=Aliiroseovarius marinus TaxID=2500159 RepID=UPI003D7D0092
MLNLKKHKKWALVCAGFIALNFIGIKTTCVRLPNGINIGKQAVLDLSMSYWKPDIVPKYPSGASLIPGDAWPFYATETTVYGRAIMVDATDDFGFAWRKDIGLTKRRDDPIQYDKIVSEAGELLEGIPDGILGVHIVMLELQKRPEYAGQRCRTRLIRW